MPARRPRSPPAWIRGRWQRPLPTSTARTAQPAASGPASGYCPTVRPSSWLPGPPRATEAAADAGGHDQKTQQRPERDALRPLETADPAGSSGPDCLGLEVQPDLPGDHDPAVGHRRVEADVEVAPVQLTSRGEPGTVAAVRVRPEAVELEVQWHALGDPLQGQIAVQDVLAALDADPGRLVAHGRVRLDLEEVSRLDVLVPLLVARVDRGKVDLGGHGRSSRVVAGHELAAEGREPPAHLADQHVPYGEADL